MSALANAKAETLDLLEDIRPELDQAGLRAIYRGLIGQASSAYVFRRSLLSTRLEQVDVRTLDSDDNFKLAMTGEKLVIVYPTIAEIPAEVLRYYANRSTDVPPRIATLAEEVSTLLTRQIVRPFFGHMFLHDLEVVLLLRSNAEAV